MCGNDYDDTKSVQQDPQEDDDDQSKKDQQEKSEDGSNKSVENGSSEDLDNSEDANHSVQDDKTVEEEEKEEKKELIEEKEEEKKEEEKKEKKEEKEEIEGKDENPDKKNDEPAKTTNETNSERQRRDSVAGEDNTEANLAEQKDRNAAILDDPNQRGPFLKRTLVTNYKANKTAARNALLKNLQNNDGGDGNGGNGGDGNDGAAAVQAAPQAPAPNNAGGPSKLEKFSKGLDKWGGYGFGGLNALWAMGDGFADAYAGDSMKTTDRVVNNVFGLGTSLIGATGNVTNFVLNHRKRGKTKDQTKRTALTWDSIANGIGLAANVSKFGGAINGLAADTKTNDLAGGFSKGFSTVATGLNFLSAATKLTGSIHGKIQRRGVVKDLGKLAMTSDPQNTQEKQAKQARQQAEDIDDYKERQAEYQSMKAKKYAVQQAKKFQENKTGRYPKGLINTVTQFFTAGTSIAGTFWKGMSDSKWGKIVKGFVPVVNLIAKYAEKKAGEASDKRVAKKNKETRIEVLDEYLRSKRDKIRTYANTIYGTDPRLTNNEVDHILLGRLGVDIPVENTAVSDQEKEKAFEKLNLKRANNILNSKEADRNSILDALRLDHSATAEDIALALKGE